MLALAILATLLLAQTEPVGWTLDGVAKVGLGVASFVAFVALVGYVVRRLLDELKVAREAFLLTLKEDREAHRSENHLLAEQQERNTDRIVEAIGQALGFQNGASNGRDRASRS